MKCLNTRAKLIIQQLYESMFHEPYMLSEGSHAKINNNPAFMPVVIEKVGRLPGYGEVISIAHYGEQSGDLMADPEMEFTIIGGDYYLCRRYKKKTTENFSSPLKNNII